jgi:hypothetical protein
VQAFTAILCGEQRVRGGAKECLALTGGSTPWRRLKRPAHKEPAPRLNQGGSCGGQHRRVLASPPKLSMLYRVQTLHSTASVHELGPQIKIDPGIELSAPSGFWFPDGEENRSRAGSTQHVLVSWS